jgi:hypothetical protein
MSEQEAVAKHTKKVYKVWASKEHSWQHKAKEFLIEIAIIVFAVSISIWFHNMSEKSHDRKEAKQYLEGLKKDLTKDITEMREDSASFVSQYAFYKKLAASQGGIVDTALIIENNWMFTNQTALIPNISRFEALKYSGKMNIIENKELLDEILNLYEEKIPQLISTANNINSYKNSTFNEYMESHRYYLKAKQPEFYKAVQTDADLNYYFKRIASNMPEVIEQYQNVIQHNEKLVKMIDNEVK